MGRRQSLLHASTFKNPGDISTSSYSLQTRQIVTRDNLKTIFFIFNASAYLSYTITVLIFSIKKDRITTHYNFLRTVCGINGISFLVLAIALLNFANRLDKVLASLKRRHHPVQNVERRVFILTVFLIIILLASSTTLLLAAWKIIKDPTDEWKCCIFILLTETLPTLVISVYLTNYRNTQLESINEKIQTN